jgi:hypothetical protein
MTEKSIERELILNGVSIQLKQYIGIGRLRVETHAGEVSVKSRDYIATFPDGSKSILSEVTVESLESALEVADPPVAVEEDKPLTPAAPVSINDILAKQKAGEKLTADEELRLIEGK